MLPNYATHQFYFCLNKFPRCSFHTPPFLSVPRSVCAHLRPALSIRTVKPSTSGYTAALGSALFLPWIPVTLRHSLPWILSVFGYVKRVFDAVSGLLQFNSGSTWTHSYASPKGVKHYDSDPKNNKKKRKKKRRQKKKLGWRRGASLLSPFSSLISLRNCAWDTLLWL